MGRLCLSLKHGSSGFRTGVPRGTEAETDRGRDTDRDKVNKKSRWKLWPFPQKPQSKMSATS